MKMGIKTLAQHAKVSIATVSLALKDDPRVALKTRTRIQQLARKYNYIPSNLGRALQARKSNLIGYLVSDITASFRNDLLQGIGEITAQAGYGLVTGITDGTPKTEAEHLRLFREKGVDGIVLSSCRPESHATVREIVQSGTPVIACSLPAFDAAVPAVVIDDEQGGYCAARHVITMGHTRIVYCFTANDRSRLRLSGCLRACREAGIPEARVIANEQLMLQALRGDTAPTAAIAYSDFDALRIKHAVEKEGGTVPGSISVVGFDDLWFAGLPEFSFTTIAQPKKEIGRIAAGLLLNMIDGKMVHSRTLSPELVVRSSTRPLTGI